MKKRVLFMTLAMAVVLTACGGKKETESNDVNTSVSEEAETDNTEDTAGEDNAESGDEADEADGASTDTADDASTDTEAETEQEAETDGGETEDEASAGDFEKGTVSETGWESKFLGMRYTAPEGMTMTAEEDLDAMMDLGQEILSEDFNELQLKYAEMQTVYEMMSANAEGTANVVITVEKLPNSSMDADQYMEAVEKNLSAITGITYEVEGKEDAKIGGADFKKLSCAADYQGVSMHQDYYVRVIGNRAVSLAVTYIDDTADTAEAIINAFEAY